MLRVTFIYKKYNNRNMADIEVTMKKEGNRITTSIKINPELLKKAKHVAIDKGMTFSDLLEKALKDEIEKRNSSKKQ